MIFEVFLSNPTMKKIGLSIIIGCSLLSSCFFVDDIFDTEEKKEETLQQKSQKAVSTYLHGTKNQTYVPYGFGPITIHKPAEIQELEELERQRSQNNNKSDKLDSLIAQKRSFIEKHNIHRTIDLDHFFTLTDTANRTIVFETNFTLNDTLEVENLKAGIFQRIPADDVKTLGYFFYEKPIFDPKCYFEFVGHCSIAQWLNSSRLHTD